MYVYIYIYVCIQTHVNVHIYIYIYIRVCVCVCLQIFFGGLRATFWKVTLLPSSFTMLAFSRKDVSENIRNSGIWKNDFPLILKKHVSYLYIHIYISTNATMFLNNILYLWMSKHIQLPFSMVSGPRRGRKRRSRSGAKRSNNGDWKRNSKRRAGAVPQRIIHGWFFMFFPTCQVRVVRFYQSCSSPPR